MSRIMRHYDTSCWVIASYDILCPQVALTCSQAHLYSKMLYYIATSVEVMTLNPFSIQGVRLYREHN